MIQIIDIVLNKRLTETCPQRMYTDLYQNLYGCEFRHEGKL